MKRTDSNITDIPLSLGQQAMYIHSDRINSVVYHYDMILLIEGKIDFELLNECLTKCISDNIALSHEVVKIGSELWFKYQDNNKTELKYFDARGIDMSEAYKLLSESTDSLIKKRQFPSHAYFLIHLEEGFHFLVHQGHHIISDFLSEYNFIQELVSLYSIAIEDRESLKSYTSKSPSYLDYVKRETQYVNSDESSIDRKYWDEWVKKSKTISMIPYDYTGSLKEKVFTPSIYYNLDNELIRSIYSLSEKMKIAPYRIVLFAFIYVLSKIQNENKHTIGFSNHGRYHPDDFKMLGYFINTTPFMTTINPELSCVDALRKISEDFKAQATHFRYPVSLLSTHLRSSQFRESGNPFFKISVNVLRKNGYNTLLQDDMDFEAFKVDTPCEIGPLKLHRFEAGQRNYSVDDIVLHILEDPNDISLLYNYEGGRYKKKTINRINDQIISVLRDIVAHPDKRVDSLNTVTEIDSLLNLSKCKDSLSHQPSENCIPDFINGWRKSTPDNIALQKDQVRLTYLELDKKVSSYANLLIKLGVNVGDTIGVNLERSLELSCLLMGIMRAGAVYLPLDPSYPIGRLKYMADDASVKIIVTDEENINEWDGSNIKVQSSKEFYNLARNVPVDLPEVSVNPDNLAYIIYTSGSTGKPKGVKITHRGAINLAYSQKKLFNTSASSNVLGFASISFDASVWEMLMAFGVGGTFVAASRDEILPGEPLKKLLIDQKVSHLTLPPSVLVHLPVSEYPDLSTIVVAGEACSKRLAKVWGKNRNFFNAYGPTETTVCATVARCTPEMNSTPIGRPISETRVYVLDRNNSLVAPGIVGELHISGPSLALGYHNKSELTEASFVPNPWGVAPFDRLYKTGDLVRWNSDDQLEYVGRVNTMIKMRGYRIELGEIEATLLDHKEITEAVIKVIEFDGEEPYLAAYVVMNSGSELDRHEIKEFLSKLLPEYMIPSAYIQIDSLPLTPSGKIDKNKLPLPEETDRKTTTDIIHVSNSYEMMIAEVWKAILNLEHVGKKDNFFDLGGHSLLLLKTQDLIQQTMKVELSTTDLFKYSTVEALAEWIQKLDMEDAEANSLQEDDAEKMDADQKAAHRKSKQKSLRSRRLKSRK